MTEVATEITFKLDGIKNTSRQIDRARSSLTGPFGDMLTKWGIRYRTFISFRYDAYSRGAGDWEALKVRQGSILRDTNTMFIAVAPVFSGAPGALQQKIPEGIRVGYGGAATHPSGAATIPQLVSWHAQGAGFLPVREIIVRPNADVIQQMREDALEAVDLANRGQG